MSPGERPDFPDIGFVIPRDPETPETLNGESDLPVHPHRPPLVEAVPFRRINTATPETVVMTMVVFLLMPTFGLALATDFLLECRETSIARWSLVVCLVMLGLALWVTHLSTVPTRTSAMVYADGLVGRVTPFTSSPRTYAGIRFVAALAIIVALLSFCAGAASFVAYHYAHATP